MSSSLLPSSSNSSTSSTPRIILSPLNPASSSNDLPTAQPESSTEQNTLSLRHHRGRSTSESDLTDHPTSSTGGTSSSLPSSTAFPDGMRSTFRDRSRSPASRIAQDEGSLRPEGSDHPLNTSWWGEHVAKPWYGSPKRKKIELPEQVEALQSTRRRVAKAVASTLGIAADVTHQALYIGVDLLELAPIPGLKTVAVTLLNIWDAAQQVDMNLLGCLRLTERCADILISVREEIHEAGDRLGQELEVPMNKLEDSFEEVYHFLIKQTSRPFLKRYLRRHEILEDIADCDSALRDALGLFGISIQIRILKQVQDTERRRQEETKAFLDAIVTGRLPQSTPDSKKAIEGTTTDVETVEHFTTENALCLFDNHPIPPLTSPHDLPPSEIIPKLSSLYSIQNSLDTAKDTAGLRQLMRTALQTTSDAQMIEVLQIGHQEMPDALKTLQRAMEHVTERDGDGVEAPPSGPGMVVKVIKKVSLKEADGPGSPLKRSKTIFSIESSSTGSSGHSSERRRDTLDREFIECGIDALQRMSRGLETSLPSWTITKYEVDRDEKIGIGFFSDVYKGTWRGRTVAIKILAESTPRKLFIREIGIWKSLRHHNVLSLHGASSASGDPPWFFVSSYMKNGSIVEYLKRIELEEPSSNLSQSASSNQLSLSSNRSPGPNSRSESFPAPWAEVRAVSPFRWALTPPGSGARTPPQDSNNTIHRERDLFRFMHEIAKGMEYLHSQGVLHGDLKGANVLVDDKYRCAISDFGQSEMKSEAYRISGTLPPHGTLRWQSPELMTGQSRLTQEMDVWAFSICCVEILAMGRIPWPLLDDDSVRHLVLKQDKRPPLPDDSRFNTQGLQDILRVCWSTKPVQRPPFSKLVKDFKQLRKNAGHEIVDSPRISVIDEEPKPITSSPDMRPIILPDYQQTTEGELPDDVLPDIFRNKRDGLGLLDLHHQDNTSPTQGTTAVPEFIIDTPVPSSRASSFIIPARRSEEHLDVIDYDGYESPPPVDERITDIKNERRYRLLLTHDYHPSLTLPLWDPSPVDLGAVGYLSKPRGRFVTLFNALRPGKAIHATVRSLPSIHGYGVVQAGTYRHDRRTVPQKSMDLFASLLTHSEKEARRYTYPLKVGHKMAYLCTETTDYRYLESLDAPKKWFRTHVDLIMQTYGKLHHIQKEDLFLVIGTLSAPNYGLFVSHNHPEGHAIFKVFATPKNGKPWGTFVTDTGVHLGPSYNDEVGDIIPVQSKKVSLHGGPWDTVLVARLRFKPDVLEPTSQ